MSSSPPPARLPSSFIDAHLHPSAKRDTRASRGAVKQELEVCFPARHDSLRRSTRAKQSRISTPASDARFKFEENTAANHVPKANAQVAATMRGHKRIKLEQGGGENDSGDSSGHAQAEEISILPGLPDHLGSQPGDIDILMCGINPGLTSSRVGHHFAHCTNHFYPALYRSGLTPTRFSPLEDASLQHQSAPYPKLGLTNLCARPTRDAGLLKPADYAAGAPILVQKVAQVRPRIVTFVGKGIAETFQKGVFGRVAKQTRKAQSGKTKKAPNKRESQSVSSRDEGLATAERMIVRVPTCTPLARDHNGLGLQDYVIVPELHAHTAPKLAAADHPVLFWCTPSTSGRVTTHDLAGKAHWFKGVQVLDQQMRGLVKASEWMYIDVRVVRPPTTPLKVKVEPIVKDEAAQLV
ncbi:G/T mismatch-specific thymine DNA glycosylase [Ceraceosorus bombacis]|uniref:G/T mismatch-specific thymine DNA glycosylase n=1 Tax=Ceraceosorus bombacis TaxID=401625 RepID=A0A0P1B8U6_9BASI|nr:G/T mismatch-specific thymine DNA glycosylase [Ceraceosorus bombacis]